jgi:hypothetical protein
MSILTPRNVWLRVGQRHLRIAMELLCLTLLVRPAFAQFETRDIASLADYVPQAIALGDFNHDGNLDMAVATAASSTNDIVVVLGRGDGTFGPPVQYTAGVGAVSIVAADLNHDGNLDLAIGSQSGYISILMGNGDGTFQPATQSPPVPQFEVFVTVGDFNGDGKPDLLAFTESNPCKCISVLLGNGDGTFQNAVTTKPPFSVQAIGVGDFNGDGKLDLATSGEVGLQRYVNILLGKGDGTFRQGASYSGETSPSAIAVGDFNGDHKLDMAISNFQGVGISVWIGNGDGTFKPPVDYATPYPEWVTAARLSGQGPMDLVAANFGASAGPAGASVFLGNGDGTFKAGSFYPAGGETRFVAVGDFNGDRKLDLVVPDALSDDVVVLLNTGIAAFSPTSPLTFAAQLIGTTSASQTVTLTNTGMGSLAIGSISASANFAVSNTCGKSLAAGATCDLNASFEPSAQGNVSGLITIADSATPKPQVIEVSGVGTVVELTPQSLNFGDQKVGTSSGPLPVVIANQGSSTITISKIATNSGNFAETNNCPTQLNSGASCTVKVVFKPAKIGALTGTLSVADNGGGGGQIVVLKGVGN